MPPSDPTLATAAGELPPVLSDRVQRLAAASPLYAQVLQRFPALLDWLETTGPLLPRDRRASLATEWQAHLDALPAQPPNDELYLDQLRRWRRFQSLRIAYRCVNALIDEQAAVELLSRLAEFCVRECYALALRRWTERYGEPWDDLLRRRARFSVLALGKLGGEELNFSSDIDLIYFYEGEGFCRRDDRPGTLSTSEFFTKVAETLTAALNAQTAEGFLFRCDTRLRPEGAFGPLVPSLLSLENYYATAGQTWERLAMLKARPIAGDLSLGAELLESLHSFRYPRQPPLSLLAEVAAMKRRTEREVIGVEALERDIKAGRGGIREIEFIAQSSQLLHAGRFPFLQTHSTVAALAQLARYGLMPREQAAWLTEAYWFFRMVEHRLQMREEQQTHELPASRAARAPIAASLGFADAAAFDTELAARRERVHTFYSTLFADRAEDPEFEAWWEFLTTDRVPDALAEKIARWFGGGPGAVALRAFVCGEHRVQVTRELVTRFHHLARRLDPLFAQLADPAATLARLSRFADRYGSRQQFLNACASDPHLFQVLALLFDRSTYIHTLLCAHPEILEEVLRPEILRKRKTPADLDEELDSGPAGDAFAPWLWLYVRAEQVRYAVGELLRYLSVEDVEHSLSDLADALLRRLTRGRDLLVVALGKYGGRELTFGSDLDLLLLGSPEVALNGEPFVRDLRRILRDAGPLGPAFEIDLRLRPHGDAGPAITTLASLADYHITSAQTWEKQLLTRARIVAGPTALARRFSMWRNLHVFGRPLTESERIAIWSMRERIEQQRSDAKVPPEYAFKTGAGGMVEIEFCVQTLQLEHGAEEPAVRVPGVRAALAALAERHPAIAPALLALREHYGFFKLLELMLRRDTFGASSTLPATAPARHALARWLHFPDEPSFLVRYRQERNDTRARIREALPAVPLAPLAPSDPL